jgi:hypothetical protein
MGRWSRRRWVVAGVLLAGLVVAVVCGLESYRYRMAIAWQMPRLAGAVHWYYQDYGELPPSVQALRDYGAYGQGATRLPGGWWEGSNHHTGPDVLYLPVKDWDGKTPYVLAVRPPLGLSSRAYYVLDGSCSAHYASEEELAEILKRDDELRAATSQPGRWAQVSWRSTKK